MYRPQIAHCQNLSFIHTIYLFIFILFHCYALNDTEKFSKPVEQSDNIIHNYISDKYHTNCFFSNSVFAKLLIFLQKVNA